MSRLTKPAKILTGSSISERINLGSLLLDMLTRPPRPTLSSYFFVTHSSFISTPLDFLPAYTLLQTQLCTLQSLKKSPKTRVTPTVLYMYLLPVATITMAGPTTHDIPQMIEVAEAHPRLEDIHHRMVIGR